MQAKHFSDTGIVDIHFFTRPEQSAATNDRLQYLKIGEKGLIVCKPKVVYKKNSTLRV